MLDSYNSPYHEPYTEEITSEIQKEGSLTLDSLKTIVLPWGGADGSKSGDRATERQ